MANRISIAALGDAIAQELTLYRADVVEKINAAGEQAAKDLATKAKATAPKLSGRLKKDITYKPVKEHNGATTYVVHAKAPSHRIFHLAVHGHATKTGGRARGNSFMANAVASVLPEYERAVEEAIRNG